MAVIVCIVGAAFHDMKPAPSGLKPMMTRITESRKPPTIPL